MKKVFDTAFQVVMMVGVLWWMANQQIGCAEARPTQPTAPTTSPQAPGVPRAGPDAARVRADEQARADELRAQGEELRRVLAEIRESVARIRARIEADRGPAPGGPAPSPAPDDDPAARALGATYRADDQAARLAALEAVATAPATTNVADLIALDNATATRGRKAAWKPVEEELGRRFPDPAKADPAAVRAFYRELVAGWKGGGR